MEGLACFSNTYPHIIDAVTEQAVVAWLVFIYLEQAVVAWKVFIYLG